MKGATDLNDQQLLRDPNIAPTEAVIAEALGTANTAFIKFSQEMINRDIQVDWRYYNDGKAWLGKSLYKWTTSRGTAKEMTAFWLSIWSGFFKVGFMFPEKKRIEVLDLPLSTESKQMIESSEQLGKMKLFSFGFEVCSDKSFEDIFVLIDFKKTIK